jgi:hypothetical protein
VEAVGAKAVRLETEAKSVKIILLAHHCFKSLRLLHSLFFYENNVYKNMSLKIANKLRTS